MSNKWTKIEKEAWFKRQVIKRSYGQEVTQKIECLTDDFVVHIYGVLLVESNEYPLHLVKSSHWDDSLKTIVITGGVHGYETSGVQGAIKFLDSYAQQYIKKFNFVVAPCVSPWSYETINRWNPKCIDPNRSFFSGGQSEEASALMGVLKELKLSTFAHIDLHETTDSDNQVFRPALDARDGVVSEITETPDGFYLVADIENPQSEFQGYIIEHVSKVTHIAPCDEQQRIIGTPVSQPGVIHYPVKRLHMCAGFTDAVYCTTTEVYPDSNKVDDKSCVLAQVTCITSALNYIIKNAR